MIGIVDRRHSSRIVGRLNAGCCSSRLQRQSKQLLTLLPSHLSLQWHRCLQSNMGVPCGVIDDAASQWHNVVNALASDH